MIRIRDLSGIEVERIEFPSAGGTVRGLTYARGEPATCVVLAHGYSSSKHNLDGLAFYLATEGLRALTFDFQGHKLGCSSLPLARAEDLVRNVLDACACARALPSVRTVVAAGHSMGAAATIAAAAQAPEVAGVIAMCTGLARSLAMESGALIGGLRNRACYVAGPPPEEITRTMDACTTRIGAIAPRPLLVVAADNDAIVGLSAVRALFEAAGEPKDFAVISATHTDCAERAKFAILRWLRARGFCAPQSNG